MFYNRSLEFFKDFGKVRYMVQNVEYFIKWYIYKEIEDSFKVLRYVFLFLGVGSQEEFYQIFKFYSRVDKRYKRFLEIYYMEFKIFDINLLLFDSFLRREWINIVYCF